ncbi:hypothetical protein SPSIL_030240 [Sporomusa silvacetica DSM 10669]|uniref:NADPH-dependent FMN reductase n=1 Tax=Sporomusa silvacetica DSM 10669 TaxID=1123289 RepID=A0ABZ3IME4_9FIRM|nr:hypothetical protein [Sporomusa silvacetica]OZC14391.1 hypothetical protein SPSIL_48800 [Sporomusa silvacetica DSM 10669]
MKTLIINGSPRKNGHAMTLVNEMTKYLNGEVRIIHTYYDDISPYKLEKGERNKNINF